MRKIIDKSTTYLFTIIIFTSLFFTNVAHGVTEENKWRITSSLNTSSQVGTGKVISYTFTISNSGSITKAINSPVLIYLPSQFTSSGFNTGSNFSCNSEGIISSSQGAPNYMVNRERIYCYPTGDQANPSALIALSPGATYSFEIIGVANANYDVSSKAYSMVVYSTNSEQQSNLVNGENIWETSPSDALSTANYPYGDYQAQIAEAQKSSSQSSSSKSSSNSNSSNSSDANKTSVLNNVQENENSKDRTSLNDNSENQRTDESKTRDPNLATTGQNDPMSWSELLSRNGSLVAISFASFLVGITIFAVTTKKYRQKRKTQKEYKSAIAKLRNENPNSSKLPDNEYKPKVRRSSIKSKNEEKSPWSPV